MQTVIRVERLSKTFNHNKALHAVDLTVQQREVVARLGPSVSGKSTLLRPLSGIITCDNT
ncbi:ATP-binding cassette domain-containing protein, partial [Enterobacter asburiae]|uniref:ATP-binding cassette domain-containing protein n=1 Tax=Enterobacter asburiae TaxID=61645 RepID=UPI0005F11E8D